MTDYEKFRGKCKPLSEQAVAADPTLRLVRGHYHCPDWGPQAHWWCERPDGTIVDPTVDQFPTKGVGAEYVEFSGMVECSECGKEVPEAEAEIAGNGHYAFCSGKCHARFVGVYI
jgi:hypothetical protein